MKRESWFSLLSVLIGLALQGAAWIWDDAPQNLRVLLTVLSLLPSFVVMLLQGVESQGVRAWFTSFVTFLRVNSPLAIMTLLSVGVLIVLPKVSSGSYLTEMSVSAAIVLLTVSVFNLIRGLGAQPSLRVLKGSSDKVYLVRDGVKRHIPDPLTTFFVLLDTYREIECVSDMELNLHREGQQLPSISGCELVKGSGPPIYVIWEDQRKHIPDPPTYNYFFKERLPKELSDVDLEAIPRTGALRSILSISPTITVHGDVGEISVGFGGPQ